MAKQSPHTQRKGCGLCKPHKHRGGGPARRKTWAELRWLGKARRITRHELRD